MQYNLTVLLYYLPLRIHFVLRLVKKTRSYDVICYDLVFIGGNWVYLLNTQLPCTRIMLLTQNDLGIYLSTIMKVKTHTYYVWEYLLLEYHQKKVKKTCKCGSTLQEGDGNTDRVREGSGRL